MKKLVLAIGLVSIFGLTACGGEPTPPPVVEVPEESADEYDINLDNAKIELDATVR